MPVAVPSRVGTPTFVGLIGFGVIGRVHAEVLRSDPRVSLAFVADRRSADVSTARGGATERHRYEDLESALRAIESGELTAPDLFVLATPTPTHLDLVAEVLARTAAGVLCEKPLTSDVRALDQFESEHPDAESRLAVVNHFAFSPEVNWGAATARSWGPPRQIVSTFNDPYVLKHRSERASYVSSWIDSGPNQVSVARRFTAEIAVTAYSSDSEGARSITEIAHSGGTGALASNWHTGSSSKQTSLRWTSGHELLLDHTAMTGVALQNGRPVEHFGNDGTVDRKVAHYTAMYDVLLAGTAADQLGLGFAREVAELLHAAFEAPTVSPRVRWVSTS